MAVGRGSWGDGRRAPGKYCWRAGARPRSWHVAVGHGRRIALFAGSFVIAIGHPSIARHRMIISRNPSFVRVIRTQNPGNPMQRIEKYLKWLLQAFGAVTVVAWFPFIMPRSWMAAVHEWLGMGMLPDRPVVEYLARTTSALYGYLGGLYLLLATDVRRYARVITYCAVATLVLTAVNTALCLRAGMPPWWMWSDVLVCWLFGVGILFLQRRAGSQLNGERLL